MSNFKDRAIAWLRKKWDIRLRNPVEVKVVYLGSNRNIVNPEKAEPIVFEGYILEEDRDKKGNNITRKVQKHGDSFFTSDPEGWLKSVAKKYDDGLRVKKRLVLTTNNERMILVSTPKGGD